MAPVAVLGLVAMGSTVVAAPRPAQAIELATITAAIGFINGVYQLVKNANELMSPAPSGPTLADLGVQLANVQAKLIAEMRSARNQALQSRVKSVFRAFTNLADNKAADPTNPSTWSTIQFDQQVVADQMFDIVMYQNDVTSSYELAPAYNSLLATGTAVLKIKGDIWPDFPSSWSDHYLWLQPGMEANYRMIGSQRHQCWPGYNPGYSTSTRTTVPGNYANSQLWTSKLANKYFAVFTFPCGATLCNPGSKHCYMSTSGCTGVPQGPATHACNFTLGDLACATSLAKPKFDADPVVKLIRASMKGIQTLSGGNDYDAPYNDHFLAEGKYVDPWITEPACGSGAPWAYPQVP